LEVIIRKKTYQLLPLIVRDENNLPMANLKISVNCKKPVTLTTNAAGRIEIPLALDEKITEAQFAISDYKITKLKLSETGNSLSVEMIKPVEPIPAPVEEKVVKTPEPEEYFKDFDFSKLDSIQSLTVFYAVFKNYQMKNLSDAAKNRLDRKFTQLVTQLEDSARRNNNKVFIGKISDSSFVNDDIRNLLSQATLENQMLDQQRDQFDQKIQVLRDKLASGMPNLDAPTRSKIITDITLLERLLTQNESRFYKNQNDYRQIINALKQKFFDFADLENQLSASEEQRLEEQRLFRQRLFIAISIILVFGALVVLLINFSNRLRKQKRALESANEEINRINTNLEGLVYERTRMLKDAHHELDTFLYRASHDLRSPMCSIIGLCNLANHFSQGEAKDLLDKVVYTTSGMDKLLKKLTMISEINQPTNFSSISINEVVENIAENFRPLISASQMTFTIDCQKRIVIHSYPNLIEAIISNLIENAVFFCAMKNATNGEGRIKISASTNDEALQIAIEDNGVGIDSKIQDRVFDMFFKGHVYSKGNGLGLYIVQKSVQALDGEISFESSVGGFTRFVVSLPLHLAPSPEQYESLHNEQYSAL
jgi:signal transduction histidine kinase